VPGLVTPVKAPIGRGDQAPGVGDSLRLVAIEERRARPPAQDGGEFPGEVHRITDAGVMPCPPTGLWMCAASPTKNARPLRK
jgi:hypothetical protein